ncbi:hypothetical protein C7M84_019570 [Penaeus vannamei]|uniref:Uncharacterized protein n=1 Tax=Penaeus vannamei TaxID=6689 RepID=A0A3R7QBJ2_PENVA|nr:hypothetical protein C7M84_019570 [Penaeus vannamei]
MHTNPERGETPVTGPWRVAEEAPPPPEDVNNLTWEHFPVIEDSPEEPQTPEEEVQEPSILSIGPHEITYKRKTTQDAEDTDTHSPLMKEVNACQHLIERVIGAIERMENIVARQDEQLTARSQGGQQLPQQSGTSQPHRSSWQGFQDHASQERRRKKRKPRKKQRKQQTQEDIRVQENAPQQREATSQPQRRRFRTQETTVEQRQDQRRNTWNPPQLHPQRNARVNRGRGTQQTPPQDFQRRPYPHQGFRRREWYPSHQRNTYRWQGQRNPTRKEDTTWETDTMVGQTIKRKLPVGNRKKRRKTVARRRSKQLGMELVALRIKRIVSEEHKLKTALQEMTGFFKARGYDNRCLNSALERVGNLQRDQLLIRKPSGPPTNDSMEERKIDCREADQSAVPVASGRAQGVNEWQTTRLRYLKENRGGPRLPQSSKPAV